MLQSVLGTDPVRGLFCIKNVRKLVIRPISFGIAPVKEFSRSDRLSNPNMFPTARDKDPMRLFEANCK